MLRQGRSTSRRSTVVVVAVVLAFAAACSSGTSCSVLRWSNLWQEPQKRDCIREAPITLFAWQ